jgi:hypothetical protein
MSKDDLLYFGHMLDAARGAQDPPALIAALAKFVPEPESR